MHITKFGHSCLLVEENGARILFDPGVWSDGHRDLKNIDAIFITHEHQDHCDIPSILAIQKNNPDAPIYTNSGVGEKLTEVSIQYQLCGNGQTVNVKGVSVAGVGTDHAEIYSAFPIVRNTGYMIGNRFFYPGDTLESTPPASVEIFALPVVAPWMRMADCLDFVKRISPKICFPVHDGFLEFPGPFHAIPRKVLEDSGVKWVVLENEKRCEF